MTEHSRFLRTRRGYSLVVKRARYHFRTATFSVNLGGLEQQRLEAIGDSVAAGLVGQ